MAAPAQPPPGEERLVDGRYALQERLGAGGLGVVWRAHDHERDRTVAIKELRPLGLDSDQRYIRERIRREALAAQRLAGHPNIVPVLDVLWEDGRPWIVMEYVAGETLQDLIGREGRISPRRAARIGVQVLDVLSAAHREGIVHRDVKPGNILIDEDGVARLTDFGIALLHGTASITQAGVIIGSPGYIAPERLTGAGVGKASDLWSLGATLYAAVEGRMPYQRSDTMTTMAAVMNEPVPEAPHAGPLAPVLAGLLDRVPENRMSAARAESILAEVAAGEAGEVHARGLGSLEPPPREPSAGPAGDRPVIDGLDVDRPISASVWHARDRDGEDRAVKVLPPGEEAPAAALALAGRPVDGVVRVRAVGEAADGRAYVLMDYAGGGSLAHRAGGDLARLVRIGVAVARGVAAANEAGMAYDEIGADQVVFASTATTGTGTGGEEPVLLLPHRMADDVTDVMAVSEFLDRLLVAYDPPGDVRRVIEKGLRGEWLGVTAFVDALEAADLGTPPHRYGLPDSPTREGPRVTASGVPSAVGQWKGPADAAPRGLGAPVTEDVPWERASARRQRRRLVPSWFRWAPGREDRLDTAPPWPPAPEDPWVLNGETAPRPLALDSPLREEFRYVHEPLRPGDTAIPLLGNEPLVQALKDRLANSMGGTFLITGFRGVGKSTLIEQAVAEITASHPRGRSVLSVVLSVARPLETERLLFAVVRRVFEELVDSGYLDDLPAGTRHQVMLAYMRTSLSFKQTRADATERTAGVELAPARIAGPAGMAIPKASMSTRRSRSLATEAAFLAYSETDVEHDTMRIIRMLADLPVVTRGRWPRRRRPLDLQLVVVLDEVDKLTALRDGLDQVERLLSGIKNVVTMRGAHYLVVAGPDLHDRVLRDSGRGNSIYESIFAWQMYVPCNWSAPRRLLDHLCLPGIAGMPLIGEFEQYLRFKSRGVFRKLLQELNAFVAWQEGRPYLRIDERYKDAIAFYAMLERTLDGFFTATRRQVPQTPIGRDRWRLGAYYVMDWILRSEGRPFTSVDVIDESQAFDPLLRVSRACAELLLDHLADEGVLLVVREPARATSTLISDVAEAQRASYKLEDSLLDRLFRILAHDRYEHGELDPREAPGAERPGRTAPIETLAGDRYELWRLIGEGGTGSVYEGCDTLLDRPVAVKLLRTALRGDQRARSRFVREAMIAGAVHHPNVVDVYEVVTEEAPDDPAGRRYAIVMELIEGLTLDQELERYGPLPPRETARLGVTLAGALEYLGGKGLARLDLKPHNVVMSRPRGPVIIDLGIAKVVENSAAWPIGDEEPERLADPATQLGMVVGTPAYLAPEQARGEEVDIRADIYALGLVLCTCLTGHHPYGRLDPVAILSRAMTGGVDTSGLPCSEELRAVLTRATAPSPEERYARPADLLAALRDTPEGPQRGDR